MVCILYVCMVKEVAISLIMSTPIRRVMVHPLWKGGFAFPVVWKRWWR